ncbi:MAG TPA: cache domain-containing protein, partial [Chloroflexota bacterium]
MDDATSGREPHRQRPPDGSSRPTPGRFRRLLPDGIRAALALLVLAIVIPLLLVEVGAHLVQFENERQEELRANLELARAVGATFDSFIQDLLRQEALLGAGLSAPASHPSNLNQKLLDTGRSSYPALSAMSWHGPDCAVLMSSTSPPVVPGQAAADACARALSEPAGWVVTDIFPDPASGEAAFDVARAVRDDSGALQGALVAEVSADKLDSVVGIQRSGNAAIALIDHRGMSVYRYPEINVTWKQRDWSNLWPAGAEARAGNEALGSFRSPVDGQQRLGAATPIHSIGWVAAATQPEAEAMVPEVRSVGLEIGMLLVAALVSLVAARTLARNMTRPVRMLREYALEVGRGRVESGITVSGPRELRDLAGALSNMARELRDREESLIVANQELAAHSLENWRLAEDARQANALLETIIDTMPVAVLMCDAAGSITASNGSARELLGDDLGRTILEAGPAYSVYFPGGQPFPPAHMPMVRALRRGQASREIEIAIRRNDGSQRVVLASASPVRDDEGKVTGAVGVMVDITARTMVESELLTRVEEQRQLQEQQEEILRTISHDLRSPLTVIMGHAGILHRLMERNDPNPRYLQGIRAIESSSSQMNSMIQDLVDVTRLETGKLKLDR